MVVMQSIDRLILGFRPINYNLSLSIDRQGRSFGGLVVITGHSLSQDIRLHAKNLIIRSASVDGHNVDFDLNDDTLIIKPKDLQNGQHIITIGFDGKITDQMQGMYPCYYKVNGESKEIIATQFESHYAREVFPCIDEPEAKATFDLTLTTETDITVLGNTPIKLQRQENGLLVTTFETTPIMSSYLLAWVCGDLQSKSITTSSGVSVNVWSTKAHKLDDLDFALDIAKRSIEFYENYFNVPYPLPKADHVALPDFAAGAMENWGLLTYRESALLCNSELAAVSDKHYIATVIAHEISHQWFGNLVTMRWWNDLWLNESFATMMEYAAVDALEPSWNVWLDFNYNETISALRRDSLENVQPVRTEVTSPDEIATLFDGAIVYAKGARLMRMLAYYIGEDNFRHGLQKYFQKYAYQNTEANDLWQVLGEVSNTDVASLMNSWLELSGFPILNVSQNKANIVLQQTKATNLVSKPSDDLWIIPLDTDYVNSPKLMTTETLSIKNSVADKQPVRFNINNSAHYIVNYDNELVSNIVNAIKLNKLDDNSLLQFLIEQYILSETGTVDSSRLIEILPAYKDETCEVVWRMISTILGSMKKFVQNDKKNEVLFKLFSRSLVLNQFNRLGWDKLPEESENDTKLRGIILTWMINSEDKEVIKTALSKFDETRINDIESEIRGLIISVAVRHGKDPKLADRLLKLYPTISSHELKLDICSGLTSTRDKITVNKILSTLTDKTIVKPQDLVYFFVFLLNNRYARNETWLWLKTNWPWIKSTFGGDQSYRSFVKYSAERLFEKTELDDFVNFFSPMIKDPAIKRTIQIGINDLKNRVLIIERSRQNVISKLAEFQKSVNN